MSKCLIVGSGPSVNGFAWPDDMPIIAVSSGVFCPDRIPDHWIVGDWPEHFDDRLKGVERMVRHIPRGNLERWGDHPNVRTWPVAMGGPVQFDDGKPIGLPAYHSLPFALQVAYRLGFREWHFIGVDLLGADFDGLLDGMFWWCADAHSKGVTLRNHSHLSRMEYFIPTLTEAMA